MSPGEQRSWASTLTHTFLVRSIESKWSHKCRPGPQTCFASLLWRVKTRAHKYLSAWMSVSDLHNDQSVCLSVHLYNHLYLRWPDSDSLWLLHRPVCASLNSCIFFLFCQTVPSRLSFSVFACWLVDPASIVFCLTVYLLISLSQRFMSWPLSSIYRFRFVWIIKNEEKNKKPGFSKRSRHSDERGDRWLLQLVMDVQQCCVCVCNYRATLTMGVLWFYFIFHL